MLYLTFQKFAAYQYKCWPEINKRKKKNYAIQLTMNHDDYCLLVYYVVEEFEIKDFYLVVKPCLHGHRALQK